jgi:hypothetical protein
MIRKSLFSQFTILAVLISLIGILNSCQKSVETSAADISALKASVSALQKTTDSLSKALAATNNNVSNLTSRVDSIMIQIVIIQTQITVLNSQLTITNTNIININAQIIILNQQYAILLAQLNAILAQLTVTPNSLSSGLLAYYPFTGNAIDSSGNINNGTVYGATLITDRFGTANSAYIFNGTSDYISLPLLSALNGLTNASFSFWIKTDGLNNSGTIIGHFGNTNGAVGANAGILIETINNNEIFLGNYSGAGGIYSPAFAALLWHHIAINIDFNQSLNTDKVKIYIDNQLSNLNFQQFNNKIGNATSTYIGRRNTDFNTYGDYFKGTLDEIRIYNRTISPQEIKYLASH